MDYRYQYLTFDKPDGKHIAGKLYYPFPSHMNTVVPLVIFSHGFAATYRDLEHYGPVFAQAGIAVLLFDFCGGSPDVESDGSTMEMSVLTEADDLQFVIEDFSRRTQAGELPLQASRPLFLMGESQGGYVSALVAARYPQAADGVVLWYPAFNLPDIARNWQAEKDCGYTREMWGIPLGRRYTEDILAVDIFGEIAGYDHPGLILHGDADPTVPLSCSQHALEVVPSFTLMMIPGAGHGFEGDECDLAASASIRFITSLIAAHS